MSAAAGLSIPHIHLNGTSRKDLRDGYVEAYRAARAAVAAMYECAPNARDYYVQAPGEFEKARAEHSARIQRLQSVADELLQIWEAVEAKFPDKR